jgi:Flp pilus assembly pilin Flp
MHVGPRRRLRASLAGRRHDEEGQTNVEYALIVAGVAVILIAAIWTFGGSTEGRFTTTANVPGNLRPPSGEVRCDSNYTGCIPPAPPKLSCRALQARGVQLPVKVVGRDPHGLDPDRNGVACDH